MFRQEPPVWVCNTWHPAIPYSSQPYGGFWRVSSLFGQSCTKDAERPVGPEANFTWGEIDAFPGDATAGSAGCSRLERNDCHGVKGHTDDAYFYPYTYGACVRATSHGWAAAGKTLDGAKTRMEGPGCSVPVCTPDEPNCTSATPADPSP